MREVSSGESAAAVLVTHLPKATSAEQLADDIRFAMPDLRSAPNVQLLEGRHGNRTCPRVTVATEESSARVDFHSAAHAARFVEQCSGRAWPPARHPGARTRRAGGQHVAKIQCRRMT